jgi:hypothetical protein
MWILTILRVKNIRIKIKYITYQPESALFSLTFAAKKWVLAPLRVKSIEIKIKIPGVFTEIRHYFLQNFEKKECGLCYFACCIY